MTPSPALIAFIQGWESCRLVSYRDQAGLWTIGWGTLLDPEDDPESKVIDQATADAWFAEASMSSTHWCRSPTTSGWGRFAYRRFGA